MVRLVEIIRNGSVDEVIDEALRRSGSLVLEDNAETVRAALKQIKLQKE